MAARRSTKGGITHSTPGEKRTKRLKGEKPGKWGPLSRSLSDPTGREWVPWSVDREKKLVEKRNYFNGNYYAGGGGKGGKGRN